VVDPDEELFDDEEGEGMVGFDVGRRERGYGRDGMEGQRVGRELEEGFRDESDEEESEVGRSSLSRGR